MWARGLRGWWGWRVCGGGEASGWNWGLGGGSGGGGGGGEAGLLGLGGGEGGGSAGEGVEAGGGLGEGDHVADAGRAGQQHHHAVPAERDAAVRRRAVLERVEQEAELGAGLLGGQAD